MKPQRFKPGQEVVCVKKTPWVRSNKGSTEIVTIGNGPKFNEIVEIDRYAYYDIFPDGSFGWFVWIVGYNDTPKAELNFEPVISTIILEKALSEVNELELI